MSSLWQPLAVLAGAADFFEAQAPLQKGRALTILRQECISVGASRLYSVVNIALTELLILFSFFSSSSENQIRIDCLGWSATAAEWHAVELCRPASASIQATK